MPLIDISKENLTAYQLKWLPVWELKYLELVQFKKIYGHCLVPREEHYLNLNRWVSEQRSRNKKGGLIGQQQDLLNDIGFVWSLKPIKNKRKKAVTWEERFNSLLAYKKQHSNLNNKALFEQLKKEKNPIYSWMKANINQKEQGRLNKEKEELFNTHFDKDWRQLPKQKHTSWEVYYEELKLFYHNYQHLHIEKVYPRKYEFIDWLKCQIPKYYKDTLHPEKKRLLDKLNFTESFKKYTTVNQSWEKQYQELVSFYEQHGHLNIIHKENKSLYAWLSIQKKKKRLLTKEQIEKLDTLKIDWHLYLPAKPKREVDTWNKNYEKYAHYIKTGKEDLISKKNPNNTKEEQNLYSWKIRTRKHYKLGYGLSEDQVNKLKTLGFVNDLGDYDARKDVTYTESVLTKIQKIKKDESKKIWDQYYKELCAFKEKHGHSYVIVSLEGYKKLANWSILQRTQKNKGKLAPERVKRLNELNFAWSGDSPLNPFRKRSWEESFEILSELLSEYKGHVTKANITEKVKDETLKRWYWHQKKYYRRNQLSKEKADKMIDLLGDLFFS